MALFFIATLAVSIAGMVSLLALKRLELSTGYVLGGRMRPAIGAWMHRVLSWAEYALPGLLRQWLRHGVRLAHTFLHRVAALAVVAVERLLETTLRLLRRKTQVPRGDAQASAFLREVSAHKKQLLKGSHKSNTIYDD